MLLAILLLNIIPRDRDSDRKEYLHKDGHGHGHAVFILATFNTMLCLLPFSRYIINQSSTNPSTWRYVCTLMYIHMGTHVRSL